MEAAKRANLCNVRHEDATLHARVRTLTDVQHLGNVRLLQARIKPRISNSQCNFTTRLFAGNEWHCEHGDHALGSIV